MSDWGKYGSADEHQRYSVKRESRRQRDYTHRRPCTSPRRHQCRAGGGYSTWVCHNPSWFSDEEIRGPDPGVKGWDY